MADFDLVVIGGGPAGYVAAIRAGQLGQKVACVERDALGGTCLNWGCIPTKTLISAAELYNDIRYETKEWGMEIGDVSFDFAKIIGRSRKVAGNLNKGIGFLLKKNKVVSVEGNAFIRNPQMGCCDTERAFTIEVRDKDDYANQGEIKQTITASKILICTGATPRPFPGVEFDGEKVLNSRHAMTITEQPKSLLVIGSGAVGMEYAYFYNSFGTKVTVVEMQDRILPIEDDEVSAEVDKAFRKHGIELLAGTVTKELTKTDKGIRAVLTDSDGDNERVVEADKVLVAIGVIGRFDGLFEESLGIDVDRGHIKVDYHREGADYSTSVPGIYAVGDVIGPPWLAHVASEEASVAVERMFGHEAPDIDYTSVPGCTYTHPQVASIGLTERACKEQGLDYKVGKFPFQASGKAQAMNATAGFVKMIVDKESGEILGCHMVGESVTEMIAEIGLARRLEATFEDVIATMHAHPTLSEAVHEATLGVDNRMIHF